MEPDRPPNSALDVVTADADALVRRAQGGNAEAFTALVERYQAVVYRWSTGLVSDRDDAEDIMQEVFVLAYTSLASFRGEASFDGWLYRITSRVAGKQRRKKKRRAILRALPAARPSLEVYITDPGGRVDRERALAMIQEAVERLPERQREVFDLVDLQGLSPMDAAALLEMKAVSLRASLFKARASVRRLILLTHPNYLPSHE